MSLIHKALNKVEKKASPEIDKISLLEEELVQEKDVRFMNFPVNKRTVVLMVLVVAAAIFAIYINFFADKKGASSKVGEMTQGSKKTEQLAGGAVAPRSSVVGIMQSAKGVQYVLSPEAKVLNDEAKILFQNGDLDQALEKFGEALKKAENAPDILNGIGLIYKKKGDFAVAKNYYTKAIENGPGCAECYNNLAVLNAAMDDNVSAVLSLKKALEISETYADAYFNIAVIMEKEGNLKSAVENYKKFLMYASAGSEDLKKDVIERIEDMTLEWSVE